MDRHSNKSLSLSEAKQSLRLAAQPLQPQGFVKDHPLSLLGLAFCGGLIIGNKKSRHLVMHLMESLFIHYVTRAPKEQGDNSQT